MKKTITLLLVLLFAIGYIATSAYALVVIYDKSSKEIYTVSSYDDTVVPEGHEKVTIPGKIGDYDFIENPTNMKFISDKFIVNTKKIDKEYKAKKAAAEKTKEEELINKRIRKIAIDQLKSEGYIINDD